MITLGKKPDGKFLGITNLLAYPFVLSWNTTYIIPFPMLQLQTSLKFNKIKILTIYPENGNMVFKKQNLPI